MFSMLLLLLGLAVPTSSIPSSNISAFLTFHVDSHKTLWRVAFLQKKMAEYEPELGKYLSGLEKLHITIDLYHVDETNMNRARTAMAALQREICAVSKKVMLNGTDMFADRRVLFGNLTEQSQEAMRTIQEISKRAFEEQGIQSLNQYAYHPHMTLAQLPPERTDLAPKLAKFRGAPLLGNQKFKMILLCSMYEGKPGFYKILDQRFVGRCL